MSPYAPPVSRQAGHTLIELLVALAVGSIVIAAAYAGYRVFANISDKLSLLSEADRTGVRNIEMIDRDLRHAGYKDFLTAFGPISTPLTVTPGTNCCGAQPASRCDRLVVTYDLSSSQRMQVTYVPQPFTSSRGTRCRLVRSQQYWNGATWQGGYVNQTVSDWVDGLELAPSNPKASGTYAGFPQTVEVLLRVRGSRQAGISKTYQNRIQVRNVALVP